MGLDACLRIELIVWDCIVLFFVCGECTAFFKECSDVTVPSVVVWLCMKKQPNLHMQSSYRLSRGTSMDPNLPQLSQ